MVKSLCTQKKVGEGRGGLGDCIGEGGTVNVSVPLQHNNTVLFISPSILAVTVEIAVEY